MQITSVNLRTVTSNHGEGEALQKQHEYYLDFKRISCSTRSF